MISGNCRSISFLWIEAPMRGDSAVMGLERGLRVVVGGLANPDRRQGAQSLAIEDRVHRALHVSAVRILEFPLNQAVVVAKAADRRPWP
jgi:hypothetical protein